MTLDEIQKRANDAVDLEYDIDYPYEQYYIKGYLTGAIAMQEYSSIQHAELFKKIKDIGDEFITKENPLHVNMLLAKLLTRIESLNTKP